MSFELVVRVEKEYGTQVRIDLCGRQNRREVDEETLCIHAFKGRVRHHWHGGVINKSKVHFARAMPGAQNQRCFLKNEDISDAEGLAGEIVDDE